MQGRRKRPRRLRSEFDDFQRDFCAVLGEPLPPIPRPRQSGSLGSFPLPEVTRMTAADTAVLTDSDDDGGDLWYTRRPEPAPGAGRRRRSRVGSVSITPARAAIGEARAGPGLAAAATMGPSRERGSNRSARETVPWGGIYLSLVLLEAKTLKAHFNATRRERAMGAAPDDEAVAALAGVLRPWQAATPDGEQLGCLFVTVRHRCVLYDAAAWRVCRGGAGCLRVAAVGLGVSLRRVRATAA